MVFAALAFVHFGTISRAMRSATERLSPSRGDACFDGIAGMMLGPLTAVEPGMGEPLLILSLVVIIIGGIGSVRGAFVAAILIGVVDTLGRVLLPVILRGFMGQAAADGAGPALASMMSLVNTGGLWLTLIDSGELRSTLVHSSQLWSTLVRSGGLLSTLVNSGELWWTLLDTD